MLSDCSEPLCPVASSCRFQIPGTTVGGSTSSLCNCLGFDGRSSNNDFGFFITHSIHDSNRNILQHYSMALCAPWQVCGSSADTDWRSARVLAPIPGLLRLFGT